MDKIEVGCLSDDCDYQIEIEIGYNPSEYWGTDADGNRGVWRPGSNYMMDEVPRTCPGCKHVYDDVEYAEMVRRAKALTEEYSGK